MLAQSWTSQFRQNALKRISEDEKFLESCGIIPIAGAELEFHCTPQNSSRYAKLWSIKEFANSGLVEGLKEDETLPKVGEIVLGKGPHSRVGTHPRERYPSTIARATKSSRDILDGGGSQYGTDINFGEKSDKRIRSLQCNISLWNSADKTPLFLNTPVQFGDRGHVTNELTMQCAQSLIEAQTALSALVSTNEASFNRYKEKKSAFGISVENKNPIQSALLRKSLHGSPFETGNAESAADLNGKSKPGAFPASLYFEDRLASSEAEPALAMLITLGGMVKGVKTYMQKKGLVDEHNNPGPQKFKAFLNSPEFSKDVRIPVAAKEEVHEGYIKAPWNYAATVPQNRGDAFKQLRENGLAQEIMGEEFHKAFCAAYGKELGTGGVGR